MTLGSEPQMRATGSRRPAVERVVDVRRAITQQPRGGSFAYLMIVADRVAR
ncbi:hypothetical protein AB0J48_30855 [Nocardia salmonicida]|uniref:hypothetical protein n=1 Tax=Nocardia salmonicida TaxID=53431 RepID=UPI003432C432